MVTKFVIVDMERMKEEKCVIKNGEAAKRC